MGGVTFYEPAATANSGRVAVSRRRDTARATFGLARRHIARATFGLARRHATQYVQTPDARAGGVQHAVKYRNQHQTTRTTATPAHQQQHRHTTINNNNRKPPNISSETNQQTCQHPRCSISPPAGRSPALRRSRTGRRL